MAFVPNVGSGAGTGSRRVAICRRGGCRMRMVSGVDAVWVKIAEESAAVSSKAAEYSPPSELERVLGLTAIGLGGYVVLLVVILGLVNIGIKNKQDEERKEMIARYQKTGDIWRTAIQSGVGSNREEKRLKKKKEKKGKKKGQDKSQVEDDS